MKYLVNFFLIVVFCFATSGADEAPGYLRLVNLIDFEGAGLTNCSIAGVDVYPKGYQSGQSTGGIGLKPGNVEVVVSNPGCKAFTQNIEIVSGRTESILIYSLPEFDEDGELVGYKIEIVRLRQRSPVKGITFSFLSVIPNTQQRVRYGRRDTKNWKEATLNYMKIKRVSVPSKKIPVDIFVPPGSENPAESISADSTGNYVVILYPTATGEVGISQFYDPNFDSEKKSNGG